MLPSVDALLAVASLAALAASGVAVGDPETAALASSWENPWIWHQTSVPWQGKLSAYKSEEKVMGRLIQYLIQSTTWVTDTDSEYWKYYRRGGIKLSTFFGGIRNTPNRDDLLSISYHVMNSISSFSLTSLHQTSGKFSA